jgi:hypothetical protein
MAASHDDGKEVMERPPALWAKLISRKLDVSCQKPTLSGPLGRLISRRAGLRFIHYD